MQRLQLFFRILPVALLAAIVLGLTGCASPAHRKSNIAAQNAWTAAAEVQSEYANLNVALETLDNLVNNPAADLTAQFKAYDRAVDRLYDSIQDVEAAVTRLQRKNADYFTAWDRQLAAMNYGITRERSQARRDAVRDQMQAIQRRYIDTREVMLPVLAYLEDIRKMLDADLTMNGIEMMKAIANNAVANGRKVQTALGELSNQLADTGREMSPFHVAKVGTPDAAPAAERPTEESERPTNHFTAMTSWIKTAFLRLRP